MNHPSLPPVLPGQKSSAYGNGTHASMNAPPFRKREDDRRRASADRASGGLGQTQPARRLPPQALADARPAARATGFWPALGRLLVKILFADIPSSRVRRLERQPRPARLVGERRAHPRISGLTGAVRIGTRIHPVEDISLGGFRFGEHDGQFVPRQRFFFEMDLHCLSRPGILRGQAVVVRVQGDHVGARFFMPSSRLRRELAQFIMAHRR